LTDFQKNKIIKLHENPSSGSWVVPCRRTDRQTDTTMLIGAFQNFVKAPTNNRFTT